MTSNPPRYNPPKNMFYILKYRKPVARHNFFKWAISFEKAHNRVRRTEIKERYVSTVFLGLDHSFSKNNDPLLFETMVFPDQDIQFRCSTWREALEQHWDVVHSVKAMEGK